MVDWRNMKYVRAVQVGIAFTSADQLHGIEIKLRLRVLPC